MRDHRRRRRGLAALLIAAALVGCQALPPGARGGSEGSGTYGNPPRAAQPIATLAATAGVSILRDGSAIAGAAGSDLFSGDIVETDDRTVAALQFADGSTVWMNGSTRVRLGSITLFFGEVFSAIERRIVGGGFNVNTDELTAAVTGTRFSVSRPRGTQRTTVTVVEGAVDCLPRGGVGRPRVRLEASRALVASGRDRSEVQPADVGAATAWVVQAHRRLRAVPGYRPPPLEMLRPNGPSRLVPS